MTQNGLPYELWFENQSTKAGTACVYQSETNVSANVQPEQLAWMVCGANPSTWIQFKWTLDYAFLFIDQGPPRSQQVEPADLMTSNSTVLSHNQFGYLLGDPSVSAVNQSLSITEDASVPPINNAIVGIGMSGAGTFAVAASPNQTLIFNPVPTSGYSYSITFGPYTFQTGDVLDVATLNPPGVVQFPAGIFSMTAILDSSNQWTISPGAPAKVQARGAVVVYEAGKGVALE